jgi:hypothetical protein
MTGNLTRLGGRALDLAGKGGTRPAFTDCPVRIDRKGSGGEGRAIS